MVILDPTAFSEPESRAVVLEGLDPRHEEQAAACGPLVTLDAK
jgi:hypothetical protein